MNLVIIEEIKVFLVEFIMRISINKMFSYSPVINMWMLQQAS